jgi:fructose-bisphosphate aldolase class 1
MSSFSTDITEQYLNKVYEDLQKEQMKLMNDIKTTNVVCREKEKQKQRS